MAKWLMYKVSNPKHKGFEPRRQQESKSEVEPQSRSYHLKQGRQLMDGGRNWGAWRNLSTFSKQTDTLSYAKIFPKWICKSFCIAVASTGQLFISIMDKGYKICHSLISIIMERFTSTLLVTIIVWSKLVWSRLGILALTLTHLINLVRFEPNLLHTYWAFYQQTYCSGFAKKVVKLLSIKIKFR